MKSTIHTPSLNRKFITIRAKITFLIIGFIPFHLGIVSAHADPIDDKITILMQERDIPGLSLAVIQNGSIVKNKGYGYIDKNRTKPVTSTTRFQAGSISKPVSAFGVLRLVEKKSLSLDENVNSYLRTWKIPTNNLTEIKKVTLRDILTHTAGLTVHGFPGYRTDEAIPSLRDVLDGRKPANTPPIRVDIVPRSQLRYSGGGYTVMQMMMIDVSGSPFDVFMNNTVLKPLGMRNSSFSQPPQMVSDMARGHVNGRQVPGKWHIYPEMAAAGLWTTASDLARFLISLRSSFYAQPGYVLSQKMAKEMLTSQIGDYGLGVRLAPSGNSFRFFHDGRNEGFDAFIQMHPIKNRGVVVMINSNDNSGAINEIVSEVTRYYRW